MNAESGPESRERARRRPITTICGEPLSVLGLGGSLGMEEACVEVAAKAGVNWFFFYDDSFSTLIDGAAQLLQRQRHRYFISTGSESRDVQELETYLERMLERVGVEVIDLFLAEYVNPKDDFNRLAGEGGVLDLLTRWKEQGRIRYTGASAHDRELATKLLSSGKIDLLMHRYNMAHRKSEERVLPQAERAGVPVLAFTATRWGSLLGGHPQWSGTVPTATYTAPATVAELRENVTILEAGPRAAGRRAQWEQYGALVYGDGKGSFETEWP
jgi:aryl-alcohol dehydrogenase-like predicted oxidoreductase